MTESGYRKTRLTAVLVSFNTQTLLVACLNSLAEISEIGHIVVVDNASTDGSAMSVRATHPGVELIENRVNVGFARAVNQALVIAGDGEILLINPDCIVESDGVRKMLALMDADDSIGIIGPATYHPTRELAILSAGEQPTLRRVFLHYSGLSRLFPTAAWALGWHLFAKRHDDRLRDVGWVSGSCMLISRRARAVAPALTERWFMYAEDMEYCRRVAANNLRIVHEPQVVATHLIGASSPGGRPSGRWIHILIDYYTTTWNPGTLRVLGFRLTLFVGLLSRSVVNTLRAMRCPQNRRSAYLTEARKTYCCALAAFNYAKQDLTQSPHK